MKNTEITKGEALKARLRHHVTGAIERGEGVAIVGIPAKPTLKKGALVKVYEKHLTKEGLEGLARLVRSLDLGDDEGGHYWEVRFVGPRGLPEAQTFERWVHACDVQT